jgi:hypothetical protein
VSGTRVQKAYNSLSTNIKFQEYCECECLSIYFYKAVEESRRKVITEDALIYLILSSKKTSLHKDRDKINPFISSRTGKTKMRRKNTLAVKCCHDEKTVVIQYFYYSVSTHNGFY